MAHFVSFVSEKEYLLKNREMVSISAVSREEILESTRRN